MSVDWQRVKDLFNEAVELPTEERDAFLGTACAGNLVCYSGSCVTPCAAGQLRCGGTCLDTRTNLANCGA